MEQIDRTTRKTLTMYGTFHSKSDIDRLYLKRKHGGRGLISIETCVRSEKNNLRLYVRESNEMLLKGMKKVGIINTENLTDRKDLKKNSQSQVRGRWQRKKMYGQFAREMPKEIDKVQYEKHQRITITLSPSHLLFMIWTFLCCVH